MRLNLSFWHAEKFKRLTTTPSFDRENLFWLDSKRVLLSIWTSYFRKYFKSKELNRYFFLFRLSFFKKIWLRCRFFQCASFARCLLLEGRFSFNRIATAAFLYDSCFLLIPLFRHIYRILQRLLLIILATFFDWESKPWIMFILNAIVLS